VTALPNDRFYRFKAEYKITLDASEGKVCSVDLSVGNYGWVIA